LTFSTRFAHRCAARAELARIAASALRAPNSLSVLELPWFALGTGALNHIEIVSLGHATIDAVLTSVATLAIFALILACLILELAHIAPRALRQVIVTRSCFDLALGARLARTLEVQFAVTSPMACITCGALDTLGLTALVLVLADITITTVRQTGALCNLACRAGFTRRQVVHSSVRFESAEVARVA
jgi:hypothetical protein